MRDIVSRQISPLPDLAHRQYEPSLENEEVHLRDYLSILSKRRGLVTGVFLTVLLIGICGSFPTTPRYKASVMLKIDSQNPLGTVDEAVNNIQYSSGDGYDYYKTQFELLKGRRLAKKVISDLNLGSNPIFLRESRATFLSQIQSWLGRSVKSFLSTIVALVTSRTPPAAQSISPASNEEDEEEKIQGLISHYLEFLSVEPVRETRLVRVEVTTPDPRLSQTVANAHAAAFIRTSIATRFELTREARDFLEKKLVEMRASVERSERGLDEFRRQHGVVSLEGNDNVVANRMLDLNRRLIDARDKRIEVESLYRALKDKNAQNLSKIIDNNRIQQLKGRLDTLEVDRARLALTFKPDHPSLQELNKQITETRQRLDREIATIQHGIESDYGVARSREENLAASADREQEAALNLKRIGIEYTILDQEAKAHQVLYQRLLQRLSDTNISNTTTVSNIEIAEEALPGYLVPTSTKRNLLVFAVLGLALGAGLAFTAEYFDSTVETPEGVWRAVGIPTLGVVPHLRSLHHALSVTRWLPSNSIVRRLVPSSSATVPAVCPELSLFHQPLSVFPESYRVIRTALLYSREIPPPVLLLTSAYPDDGKTMTTVNLAISLAQNDYSVVVIDADLRKGNCHTLLQMDNPNGLSDVLSDRQSLQACVRPTRVPRLWFLSRGASPTHPTDLLSSLQMKEVLAELRERFDFVLIDSPPALVVGDAAVLSSLCDGVILVINGQKTTFQMTQLLRERLEAVHAPIVGVILNAVNLRNPKYAYYRSYYKSYPATTVRSDTRRSTNEPQRS